MKSFKDHLGVKSKVEIIPETEVTENAVRYEALAAMKEIQASIANVSLLGVLGVMREDNPLRANILDMEAKLHDLSAEMGQFIADNIADVETEEGEDAELEPEPEEEEVPEEKPEKKEKPKKKEEKPEKKEVKDEEKPEKEEEKVEVTESTKPKVGDYVMFTYRSMELGGTIIDITLDNGSKMFKIDYDAKIDPYLAQRFTKGREPVITDWQIKTINGKKH